MTTKTKISGVPAEYDANKLQALQAQARAVYAIRGAKEDVKAELPLHLITELHDKLSNGYTIDDKCYLNFSPLNLLCQLYKPADVQEKEMALIDEQVKQKYISDLEAERELFKQLLIQQLMEAEEERERKRQEQARAKKLKEFEDQANECFGELKVPAE